MAYKYLYIDDTKDKIEQGTINGLQDGGEIEITFKGPGDWEVLLSELSTLLNEFDGIILDLRLNLNPYEGAKHAQYRGSTVAQELRTLAKEGKFKSDFPIVLISGDAEIAMSLDQTSKDLFDFFANKTHLEQKNGLSYLDFRRMLKWLAEGYKYLNSIDKKIESIFAIGDILVLDSRFVDEFNEIVNKPIHTQARFIIKNIINHPSFLIDENYLSARLGIDTASEHWKNLLDKVLAPYRYNGAFSTDYARWWMHGIEQFWEQEISAEDTLRSTSAQKRVELIVKKTGLTLTPISKQDKSKSDSFWTVCKATKVAIDTIDGFVVANQDDLFPWQEKEYVSINEALRPTRIDIWHSVASLEKNRLQSLKDMYGKAEQRIRK